MHACLGSSSSSACFVAVQLSHARALPTPAPLPSPPGPQQVGELRTPLMLCDSLAGARVLRGVAALLHIAFCRPASTTVVSPAGMPALRCWLQGLPALRHSLQCFVTDCRAGSSSSHRSTCA